MARKLENIHVFVVENEDGDEGIAAYADPTRHNRFTAMVASSDEKLEELTSIAQMMVSLNPTQPIRIVRFSQREDVAEVEVVDDQVEDDRPA